MKKIILISQYFPPENGAAAERMKAFAEYFHRHYDLEVITTVPRHMLIDGATKPTDFPFPVLRISNGKVTSGSNFQRLIREICFAVRTVGVLLRKKGNSLALVSTPSPFLAIGALILNRVQRRAYILDIRDLYPEVVADTGLLRKSNPVYKLAVKLMTSAYRHASMLTYVNKEWSNHMLASNPNAMYLPNGISRDDYVPEVQKDREDLILYSGNFGRMYDFLPILKIAQKLKVSTTEQLRKVRFILVGDGVQAPYLIKKIEEMKLNNVELMGPFNKNEVSAILHRGKIGLVSLKLDANSLKGAVPNKLFDYLQAGLNTIALIPETLSPEILSTGLVSVHTTLDYDKLVEEVSDIILNYEYKEITPQSYPFLYREYHLSLLKQKIKAGNLFSHDVAE